MDPLSITVSVTALLQFTGQVIGYIADAKSASKDQQKILEEVKSAQEMLSRLKVLSAQSPTDDKVSEAMQWLNFPNGPFQRFEATLETLAIRLQPTDRVKKLKTAMSWSFKKDEVKEILQAIDRQKNSFVLALQSDNMWVPLRASLTRYSGLSRAIRKDLFEVKTGITALQLGQKRMTPMQ